MREINPPRLAIRFLRWFCPPELIEGIEGDLLEQFELDGKECTEQKAKRRFFLNALKFFRPSIILRNRFRLQLVENMMIGNYFKVAIRNIAKRKLYSFINAVGLSIGIAFCVLIYLYIQDELSFDQFHANKNLIYRLEGKSFDTWKPDTKSPYNRSASLMTPLRQALKDELPEVAYATRYQGGAYCIVKSGDKVFGEAATYVDADFFKMFSFRLLSGNREKLFSGKLEAVIPQSVAKKYFGDENPLGKILQIDMEGNKEFVVTGVIEDQPANSSISYSILIPQESFFLYEKNMKQWGNFNNACLVQLVPNTDLIKFKSNLDVLLQKYMGDKLEKWRKNADVPVPADVKMLEIEFTQLPDWHLKKEIDWDKVSDPQYSIILSGIAILILIIAVINYVSLVLTTSASRRIEVGIRKVAGAQRSQLIWQFSIESIALSILSMAIAIGLVFLFLPAFNQFTGKAIEISLQNILPVLTASLSMTILIGFVAGSYPSLFLSNFRPAVVLKGTFTSKMQAGFAKPLVVLQFALSAFLVMSSLIMYQQMKFVTTKDLGYNKDQVLVMGTQTGFSKEADKMVERVRTRLQRERDIVSVAGTGISFNQGWSRYGYKIKGEQKAAYVYPVDPYYLPTMGLKLVMGRNFDASRVSDSTAIIVNEALVRDMKWTDPLNEYLNYAEDSTSLGAKVIGVVKDYHFLSLERNIEPMFLSMSNKGVGYLHMMHIKLSAGNLPDKIETVRKAWKELAPDKPFEYSFLDENVAKQYQSYERWMSIMQLSTGFAILISCLGLFGLAGINALNRTKEIGIRKVMGADLKSVFILLNKQFVWLAGIAFVLAAPLSWYVMNQWLKDFKYKITIGWQLFAVSVAVGLITALLTVSYHAIKAALINPADTLKYE